MCQPNYSSRQFVKLNFCWQISQLLEEKKEDFHHFKKKKVEGIKEASRKVVHLVHLTPNSLREQYIHTVNKGLASND